MTIEKIYGAPFEQLKPPAGYRFRMVDGKPEFRMSEPGEYWMRTVYDPTGDGPSPHRRLILERVEGTDGK